MDILSDVVSHLEKRTYIKARKEKVQDSNNAILFGHTLKIMFRNAEKY
jgi:hypothetical protein